MQKYIVYGIWANPTAYAVSAAVTLRVCYPRVIFNVGSYLVSAFHGKAVLIAKTTVNQYW